MSDLALTRQRAVASGIQIQLGLLTLVVDAIPVRRPGLSKTGFSRRCPECAVPARVTQVYSCADQHGPFKESELGRGRDVDGEFVAVSEEEYEEAMGTGIAKGEWPLSVFPADQVTSVTLPDESAYRLRPGKGTSNKLYGILLGIASDARYALVGELAVKGAAKPYRLTVWGEMLIAQSIIRPDDLTVPEGTNAEEPDAKIAEMAKALLEGELTDFDADTFRSQRAERLAALDEAKRSGDGVVVPMVAKVAATGEADVLSLLQASLAKTKKTRKRAPARKAAAKKEAS